jgi:hypothetical protein
LQLPNITRPWDFISLSIAPGSTIGIVLSFEATISYADGIKRTIDWFEEDPKRQTVNQKKNELIDRIITDYENI